MPNEDMLSDAFVAGMTFAYMIAFLVGAVIYILQSVSLYRIAKRRWIRRPWLSWIPIGSAWMMGSISDQYQYVVKGKVRNKRKALLILNILMWVAYMAFYVAFGAFLVQAIYYDDSMLATDHTAMLNILGATVGVLATALILLGLAIAVAVIQYMALYDLFRSCEPEYQVLYLLLSIFINGALPILLIICSGKDLGMPPRKDRAADTPELGESQEDAPAIVYEWQPEDPASEE